MHMDPEVLADSFPSHHAGWLAQVGVINLNQQKWVHKLMPVQHVKNCE